MKKIELLLAIIAVPIDFLMIVLAGLTAYSVRLGGVVSDFRPVVYALPLSDYFYIVCLMALGWIVIFALTGLYNIIYPRRFFNLIPKIFLACSIGILVLIVLIFFRKEELFSSRFIVLAIWLFSVIYMIIGRWFLNALRKYLYKEGIGRRATFILGGDRAAEILTRGINSDIGLGLKVVGTRAKYNEEAKKVIKDLIVNRQIDDFILADQNISKAETLELKNLCDIYRVVFKYAADIFDSNVLNWDISIINDIPVVELKKTSLDGWGRVWKRIMDIIGSIFAIVIFSPVMLISAIAIKLDSRGAVIYKNKRVSKDGEFFVYKFRYMKTDLCTGEGYGGSRADFLEKELIKSNNLRQGPLYKIKDDPRKTRVGKYLEKYSIDELPQFFNVLLGQMSLVGPRPHQPREVEKYLDQHKKVFTIKPGVTGLPQISGRSDLNFEDEVRLDLYYIENWSIWFDLYIIFKTPIAMIRRRTN